MREMLVRCRATTPGAAMELVVLASGRRSCIGIDTASGALVRSAEPTARPLLDPFSIVSGTTTHPSVDCPEQPELVAFAGGLTPIGSIQPRRAERLIRPLLHPTTQPLLGFYGPSIPWWERETVGPSVAIADVGRSVRAHLTSKGLRATFVWNRQQHDLPLEDVRVLAKLDWLPEGAQRNVPLARLLGYQPERIVIAMSGPRQGYCPKVVAGLLPEG